MQRVKRTTAVAVLPAAPGGGTPGYFASPNPQGGVPATVPGFEWYNNVQEELMAVIEGMLLTPSDTDRTQLFQAIKRMFQAQTATAFTSGGAAPNFTLTPVPALANYTAGQRFRVKFHAAGTGNDVINVCGLGNKNIFQYDAASGAKSKPVIVAGQLVDVEYDGVDFVLLDPISGTQFSRRQAFTSSGSFTVPAGVSTVYVTLTGGGGGGAGGAGSGFAYGGGGGGGAQTYDKQPVNVTPGQVITVTIGAGGAPGAGSTVGVYNNGNSGGVSSFGALLSASGGAGGVSAAGNGAGGGPGGVGGQQGGTGVNAPTTGSDGHGGIGGSTLIGKGATSGHNQGNPVGFGAGGAGGRAYTASGQSGTYGANGYCLVEW